MKDITTPVSSRIPQDLLGEINSELLNSKKTMTEWIREAIEEKLTNDNKGKLERDIRIKEEELDQLKKKRKQFKEKEKLIKKIPDDEVYFLLECKKVIDTDFNFIKGRINLYKNQFQKDFRISDQEFLEILRQAEQQSNEKHAFEDDLEVKA